MAQTGSMKQIGSRNTGCTVERMQWSNKMDLIAFGNEKGEVIIQRLNWQRIVTFPSPGDDVLVRSLCWQMDETVLAVGYSNGKVALLDAEREDLISGLSYDEDIKEVYFSKAINTSDYRAIYRNYNELTFNFFLPALPPLNGIGGSSPISIEDHKSFAKGLPCFLVVLLASGKVHLLLLGALKAGSIELSQHVAHPDDFKVYDVRLSGEFSALYALVRDGQQLKVLHFHNSVLQQYISPMLHLAVHCANILETKNYINDTIQCMLESWETVLLEMDNKLTRYANQQPEGSISADFLELLVFGYATNEIEEFLMDDLTEKGLKKLANSVDLSYSSIQNLIAKPLQSAAMNMFYFLNTTKGLGRINYFFEPLISSESVEQALRQCGAFLMKVLEMQQVIDQCVNEMKLFFGWLTVAIVRLHQQDLTEEMTLVSPEDTIYLAEYLNSFEDCIIENEDGTVTKRKFNLEKVGQYLENKDLQQLVKSDMHHLWNRLLSENECLRSCALLYPHEKQASLLQQRDKMLAAIDEVFKLPNESITDGFELNGSITCCQLPSTPPLEHVDDFVRSSFFVNATTQADMLVTTIGWQEALVMEFDKNFAKMSCLRIHLMPGPFSSVSFTPPLDNLRFIDLQFYNEQTLSLLLQSSPMTATTSDKPSQCHFVQFPLDAAQGKTTRHTLPNNVNLIDGAVPHSIYEMIDSSQFKSIDGVCTHLAVSGSRKVATTLSDTKKKMTIFEMEIEDDEDETDTSQNSLLEISKESAASSHE